MSSQFDVYNDINARTEGEIYIGVVGPVRTGKSTFIKRFMDLLVIPNILDLHSKERAIDELPQSAAGKTIMTTEPKFIPKEAAHINLGEETDVLIRLIDCVGYMVDGAVGHIENDIEREDLINTVKNIFQKISLIKDVTLDNFKVESDYIDKFKIDRLNMRDGSVDINVEFNNLYYYRILSDMVVVPIEDEYELIGTLKDLSSRKKEFEQLAVVTKEVQSKGYGVVSPMENEIQIESPEVIKHGNKYGVRIKAKAPSIHMIKADIITDVAPIVGSEEQANDLIAYINENTENNPAGIWDNNIFGKSIRQLVDDGINTKINKLTDESQVKLQETMQKIINDSNGGLICIII